jgi:hypothetical protein
MGSKELQRFIDNKSLVALRKFAVAEAELKELKKQHEAVLDQIKEAMIENDVDKIEGDWGYITLAERITYKAIGTLSPEFTKSAIDTEKVKAHAVLTGDLPVNVAESKTQYITKKIKVVE